MPYRAASATSSRARASWAALRARTTVPPTVSSASMPSSCVTRATSATVSRIAAYCALAAAAPDSRASVVGDTGNRAEHQPPLRPEAPKPT